MKTRSMTAKQSAFAEEYMIDLNATQAAVRAGYSAKTAGWIGPQLLGKTHIKVAVADAQAKRAVRTQITAAQIVIDLMRLAKTAEAAGKYGDAIRALELLGKHLAMFTDRVEMPDGPSSISIFYRRAKPDVG